MLIKPPRGQKPGQSPTFSNPWGNVPNALAPAQGVSAAGAAPKLPGRMFQSFGSPFGSGTQPGANPATPGIPARPVHPSLVPPQPYGQPAQPMNQMGIPQYTPVLNKPTGFENGNLPAPVQPGNGFEGNLPQPRPGPRTNAGQMGFNPPGNGGNGYPGLRGGTLAGNGATFGGGGDQQLFDQVKQQQDAANAANQARYEEILGLNAGAGQNQLQDLNNSYAGIQGMIGQQRDRLNNDIGSRYGALMQKQDQQRGGELGFQDQQRQRQLDAINGMSDAELSREKLRQRDELGSVQQYAMNTGTARTSAPVAGVRNAYDRGAIREAEINDRKLNRQLGVEDQYTGRYGSLLGNLDQQALGLGQRGADMGIQGGEGADRSQLASAQDYGQNRGNLMGSLRQDREGVIERRTDEGPDLSLYAQLLAQARNGGFQPGGGYGGLMGSGGSYAFGGSHGNYASTGGGNPFGGNPFQSNRPPAPDPAQVALANDTNKWRGINSYYNRMGDEWFKPQSLGNY